MLFMFIQQFKNSHHDMTDITALKCFLIVCAIGIPLVRTQGESPPQVVIVENDQTVREGGSVSFLCIVSNPVAGSTFFWTHNVTGTLHAYSPDTSDPRITVTVVSGTSSTFMITNLSISDSGLISCRYAYVLDGTSITINADRSVCVASQPKSPPSCLEGAEVGETVQLVCLAVHICPDHVTLRWFDVGGMTELTGDVTRRTNVIEHLIITSRPDAMTRNYLCQLESRLYPMVRLNCSNSQSPPGVMSTIKSPSSTSSNAMSTTNTPRSTSSSPITTIDQNYESTSIEYITTFSSGTALETQTLSTMSNGQSTSFSISTGVAESKSMLSMESGVTKPDKNQDKVTFHQMTVIIAACVGGGVMLIIIVIVVFLFVVCKRTCKENSDDNFQVKFARNNIKIQSENRDANHDNLDALYYSEEEHHQESTSDKHNQDDIPLYAKPDKTHKNVKVSKSALQDETSLDENVITPYAGTQGKLKAGYDYKDPVQTRQVKKYSTLTEIEKPRRNLALQMDSDPYARVQDTGDGDVDRSKIELPKHQSVNEYAYTSTGLRMVDPNLDLTDASSENDDVDREIDDGPHYFVLKKDVQNNVEDIENIILNDELETNESDTEVEENQEIQGYKSDKDALIPPQRLHENADDSNFPIEHNNTKKQPENGDENHNNLEDHLYSEEKETNEENLVDTDAMPIYAKPDKTKKHVDDGSSISAPHTETSLIEHEKNHYAGVQKNVKVGKDPARRKQPEPWPIVPQPDRTLSEVVIPRHKLALVKTDSDPYARVQDTNDGETDRPKMKLPEHESVNQYAYAFTGLRMLDPNLDLTDASSENDEEDKEMDDGPHYFILNKDGQNKTDDTANTKVNDEIYFNESDLEVEENPEIYHKSDKDTLKPMQSIHEDASVGVDGIQQN